MKKKCGSLGSQGCPSPVIRALVGCPSLVVRALVAEASGPGFESPATTKIFFTFILCFFFQTPLDDKVSI